LSPLAPSGRPDAPRLHHVGYVVEDLEQASSHFALTYGVGPFLAVPHVEFDELTFRGEPCTWEHSLAFAAWGGVQIELQQVDEIDPPELAELIGRPGVLSHASYRVPDLAAETERLGRRGVEPFLHAETGAVSFSLFHDPELPTYIEVHHDNAFVAQFDSAVAAATREWDGSDPLRRLVPGAETS
jgi:methylmalonyl-CoA/ethylmalonyl-CoA epimerase